MAAGQSEGSGRSNHNSESTMDDEYMEEPEPCFSDSEDFLDDVTDDGN